MIMTILNKIRRTRKKLTMRMKVAVFATTIEMHFDHHFNVDLILDCLASHSNKINL